MTGHTKRQTRNLLFAVLFFTLLATSLAVVLRYRQTLVKLAASQQSIKKNLPQVRATTTELQSAINSFKLRLPGGHDRQSTELTLYNRLDEIKSKFTEGILQVKESKSDNGMIELGFDLKQTNPSYSSLLNIIGTLETSIFPFVNIKSVSISADQQNMDAATSDSPQNKAVTADNAPKINKTSNVSITISGEITTLDTQQPSVPPTLATPPTPTAPKGAR